MQPTDSETPDPAAYPRTRQRMAMTRAQAALAEEKATVLARDGAGVWRQTLLGEVLAGLQTLEPETTRGDLEAHLHAELDALGSPDDALAHLERSVLVLRATTYLDATAALADKWREVGEDGPAGG